MKTAWGVQAEGWLVLALLIALTMMAQQTVLDWGYPWVLTVLILLIVLPFSFRLGRVVGESTWLAYEEGWSRC